MRKPIWTTAMLAGILLFGCSPISVRSDYDRSFDFSGLNTYRWMAERGQRQQAAGSLVGRRIERAVNQTMAAKGYNQRESGRVDFLIASHTASRNVVDVDRYGYRGRRVSVHSYKEGTIILDIVDPGAQELVWRGWASGAVGRGDNAEAHITTAVEKILEKFPPRP